MPSRKPPTGLKAQTRRWWIATVESNELNEQQVKLLTLAAQAWDQSQRAIEHLRKHGDTYNDRFQQPKPRPEVAIAKDAANTYARMLRIAGLVDVEPPSGDEGQDEEYFG